MSSHPLDRPVWNALRSGWAALAEGDARALRLQPDHGPFGAAADASAPCLAALCDLILPGRELWIVEAGEAALPDGVSVERAGVLSQMVADRGSVRGSARTVIPNLLRDKLSSDARSPPLSRNKFGMTSLEGEIIELSDADAAEMQALAQLTKPGPFLPLTHRLGRFVGVRRDGRLVAMAGERMRVGHFAEVSGVCTDPDHRGQGYAAALMGMVIQRMLARGETPFLHSYADNAGAIALYESLGFRFRRTIRLTVLARPDQGSSSKLASP